ncbi:MAG: hypothetical protein M3Q55_14720 [Acidobacteriota bacterium]|nr:hypothetical protein [Acidobacteriota bacterium]
MKTTIAAALSAGLIILTTSFAEAQTSFQSGSEPRFFLSANGVFQLGSSTVDDRFEFVEFAETGTIETSFDAGDAIGLDGGVGVRLWRNFGVGGAVSTYAPEEGGEVTARLPHPFHFNQHREVTGEAGLTRKETAIHASVLYFVPIGEKLQAIIGAGPTFFQADQSFVNDVLYTHEYPYDTATFTSAEIDNESASGVGFNASLDLSWRFSRSFGVGGIVRYATATLPFTPGERSADVEVGGVQAGLGIRVIF